MAQKDIGYLIKNINDKMKAKADADLKNYGLTLAQSRVLAFLNSCNGETTQKEIEVFLEVSHPTVVGVVSRMEKNGYLKCRPSVDGRNKVVCVTDKAKEIAADMEKSIRDNERNLLRSLSIQDQKHLQDMLLTILKDLD